MKLTPHIQEIFGGLDLSTDEKIAQAYEEGFNGNYLLTRTLLRDDYSLCDNKGYVDMDSLQEAVEKNLSIFLKSRQQRLWEIAAKAICDSMIGYVTLGKIVVGGEFVSSPILQEAAKEIGFIEEPKTNKQRDKSLLAMARLGGLATSVLERFILANAIFLNRLNKQYQEEGLPLEEREAKSRESDILQHVKESYTEGEITSFEEAVISTYEDFLMHYLNIIQKSVEDTSLTDCFSELKEAADKYIAHRSELLMLTTLQEIAEEEDKPAKERKYTDKQAAFVVKYVELKYPEESC